MWHETTKERPKEQQFVVGAFCHRFVNLGWRWETPPLRVVFLDDRGLWRDWYGAVQHEPRYWTEVDDLPALPKEQQHEPRA